MVDARLQEELQNEAADFNWKFILVGNKRVGKTSISNRFCHGNFNEDETSSQEVKFTRKNMNIPNTDKTVQLHVWDTLGQEKFLSLAPLFFRKAVGAFLVYDVTSEESFHGLQRWVDQLKQNAESKIIIILIGNKVDLER